MKKSLLILGFTTLSLFLFSGCASKMQAPQNSGFFQNYKQFDSKSHFIKDAKELSKYEKIYVENVNVIPAIDIDAQTDKQKKLYTDISTYATTKLKQALKLKNSISKTKDVLVLNSALSTSEVHFKDKNWNQFSPLALGITVVSLNAYLDESARLVGEYKLDAKEETLAKSLKLIKEIPISLNGDFLTLQDLKKPIDAWVDIVVSEINKGMK